jgi:hypothetical protein
MSGPGILSPEEYERRREFLDGLKGLTKAEHIEIVRILQKHEVAFSENTNGIFFNLCLLDQPVFDALLQFLQFTQSNRRDLAERERFMSSLATEMKLIDEKKASLVVK